MIWTGRALYMIECRQLGETVVLFSTDNRHPLQNLRGCLPTRGTSFNKGSAIISYHLKFCCLFEEPFDIFFIVQYALAQIWWCSLLEFVFNWNRNWVTKVHISNLQNTKIKKHELCMYISPSPAFGKSNFHPVKSMFFFFLR